MSHLETTDDKEIWSTWLAHAGVEDVYFSAEYAEIWAREERGSFVGVRYESRTGQMLYPLILVPLDSLPGGTGLLEARTPYDFGGPRGEASNLEELHREFRVALLAWLRGRRVVSEFSRVHPLTQGGCPPDAEFHALNFVVDLTSTYDDLFASQHRRHRRAVRGFNRRMGEPRLFTNVSTEQALAFSDLYGSTMARLGASLDYCFARDTLADLMALDEVCLVTAGNNVESGGAALFLRSDQDLFYFLGASADNRAAGTNNAIFDTAIRHGQALDLRALHLGGGGQSLREFKSQIATGTVRYSVLRRVIDETGYADLCEACGVAGLKQFPAFRSLLVERRRD